MSVTPTVRSPEPGRTVAVTQPGPAADPPSGVLDQIERQARRSPGRPALRDDAGVLGYAELLRRIDALASVLRGHGVGPGELVGICLPRGREAIVAMLAVIRAGAGYLPLDPTYPPARLALMVTDARPVLVLTGHGGADLPAGTPRLALDAEPVDASAGPATVAVPDPEDPAYVIFTSGSTGRPKGVSVPRRALEHFCRAARERYDLAPDDRVLQFASLSFDASVEEIFPPLAAGATVVIRDEDAISSPRRFLDHCDRHEITVLDLPTAYWHELVAAIDRGEAELPAGIRLVIIGGEAAQASAITRWHARVGAGVRLFNTYGPTEATVVATCADLTGWSGDGPVPIGRPLSGVSCAVVGEDDRPVAVGEPGELRISGPGVATGYLNRPDLTAERFPLGPDGRITYATGDRVRELPDGQLAYLGRLDNQVKIRGFRVELGEIETALRRLPGVTDAVVVVDQGTGQPRLVGHLLTSATTVDAGTVRRRLGADLPAHLVPAAVLGHRAFPLTAQGKVDRAALARLPLPATAEATSSGRSAGDTDDPVSTALAARWTELLGVPAVGPDDDLFTLGADSLDAIRLLGAVRHDHGAELTLTQLYAAPTPARLATLIRTLTSAAAPADPPPAVAATADADGAVLLPLTGLQQDFWIAEQVCADLPAHTLGIRYRLPGAVRADLLAASLDDLVRRHPALRSRVPLVDGEPRLCVEPTGRLPLTEVDLGEVEAAQRARRAAEVRDRAVREPFDLAAGPLARAVLIRDGLADELLLVVHHLVFDGWSAGLFGDELAERYAHHTARIGDPDTAGETADATALADLAGLRVAGAADPALAAYWRERFTGADLNLELPTDRPRPAVRSFASGRVSRPVDPALLDALRASGRTHQASLFMVLLAGLQTVLSRYTGRTDVTVLAPVAGRNQSGSERVIGAALNILPMRGDVSGEPTFSELLGRARAAVLADLDHQDLPLPHIIAATGRPASANRNRLTGVMLTVHNTPVPTASDLRYAGEVAPAATMVDLAVGLDFPVDGPVLSIDYATELFDAERVDALLNHLLTLLDAAAATPDTPVSRLPMLTSAEAEVILHDWNDSAAPLPAATALHQLFERCVADSPQAPALTWRDETVSYGELNRRANRLARVLRADGVLPGSRVAICLDRGIELFVAMWAVLKAGGAYVPLDPAYPADRLRYMIDDSRAAVLVTRVDLATAPTGEAPLRVVTLDRDAERIAAADDGDLTLVTSGADPAYVIYTSGSTGQAKGVVVSHHNLVHAAAMWQRAYHLEPGWTYQQAASFSFDMFVGETLRAHCTGGRLVVVPREVLLDPAALYALMRTERVECTELVPAVLRTLLAHVAEAGERLDFVRLLIGGGEKWHVREYRQARDLVGPGGRVVNAYGVTEVSVDNVYFDGDVDTLPDDAPLPIGRPFPNNRVYVLDTHRQPVPVGVVGELYLGGVGVATGYHDRPELTADRFVADPYAPADPGAPARMYRTGDGARFRRDGTVDFLGRLDDQVKVNGYRVELGEIEATIAALPDVLACAAAVHEGPTGLARLVAYLVPRPGVTLDERAVRDAAAASLPAHMVPARLLTLPALPLTPNGKLDRRALPAPPELGTDAAGTPPRTDTERRIADAWCAELGRDTVGIDDSFFALGGDSFAALRLVRRIDAGLALVELYQQPTVRALAALLDERSAGAIRHDGLLHRLTPADADRSAGGVTVVAVPYSGGSAISYQPLADALPADWALYAVELPGHDRSRPDEALLPGAEVAERVLAELREITGPVLLYGHCLGTAVTLQIARRAEEEGVELRGVGLGASFPTARLPGRLFDWFYRLVPTDRFTSDREYLSYLRARGGFTDVDDPADEAFVLRNVRHDARDAEEYYTAAYRDPDHTRLRAPVLSVIGERDRVTELYQERHQEWTHVAERVELAVLPRAGHFFVRTHAVGLAEVLVALAARSAATTDAAPTPIAAPMPGAAPPPTAAPMPAVAAPPRGPVPSLARFAVVAFGQFVSMVGSGLSTLVLSIWVYQQTGAITDFAVVSAVGMLPGILAGPIAGAVADRWDRRRVMLVSDAVAAAAMVALVLLVTVGGGLRLWQIYLAVSITSLAGAFQRPAYLAAVAQLVPKRYLGHANGISQLGVGVGLVFAPMLGAGLIGVLGIRGVILIDVSTFCVGVVTLLLVRFPDRMFRRREEPFRTEVANGWRYVARRPGLRAALRFFVIDHAFYTLGFAVITPMLLIEQSPVALGLALSAGGVGGLLGSLTMGLWGGTPRRATGMILFMGVASLAMAVVGIGASPVFAVVGMFALTFAESLIDGHWIALIQTKVGFDLQGRVLSIFITVMMLTMPLGYLVVGPLADHYVQPLLEPGGALAGTVGAVIGTGPGRGLALLVVLSGLLQLGWAIRGWLNPTLRLIEDDLPDALPPAEIGDRDDLQRLADAQLTAARS
ncbi:amino acid adenylation domain-containing protein [Micromonospora sp. NPDC050276]|uniref:amino acid adenylation domain-containing protein n=1 Tax=Micromonospora sp. NPDC050276 TaxID=3364278 RepID=UPI00379D0449